MHLPFDYSLTKSKSRCEYANFQIAHYYNAIYNKV